MVSIYTQEVKWLLFVVKIIWLLKVGYFNGGFIQFLLCIDFIYQESLSLSKSPDFFEERGIGVEAEEEGEIIITD